jgi:hypothetical protein
VLSAGAIESAHLLMLSGIGPADDLRSVGVAPIADLPVGRRTSDHPRIGDVDHLGRGARRPVLEVLLVDDGLEIRPYTGGSSPWSATGRRDGRTGRTSVWP